MKAWLVLLCLFMLSGAFALDVGGGTTIGSGESGSSSVLSILPPPTDTHRLNESFVLSVQVFNQNGTLLSGNATTCRVSVYNASGDVEEEAALANDSYYYSATLNGSEVNERAQHTYSVWCANGVVGGYVQGYFLMTESGQSLTAINNDFLPVGIASLLPALLAMFLLIGAITLNPEDHGALKIALFLFSMPIFYISVWYSSVAVARYYAVPELLDAIGDGTFYIGIGVFVLILYFILYFIYKAFLYTAGKKDERLNY